MSSAVLRRFVALCALAAAPLCLPSAASAHPAGGMKLSWGKVSKRCAAAARGKRHPRRAQHRCLARIAAKRDRTKPTVALTSPTGGSTVSGPISGSACEATASDKGGVDRVEFSVDGTALNVDRAAPYNCTWDTTNATSGQHTVKARAVDTSGNVASTSVTVSLATSEPAPAPTPEPTPEPTPTTTPEPTPTPTPEPTPTPTPTPEPTPTPSPSGFPDATTTGVPTGTGLTAYSGPSTITAAGTVIDGKTLGCISVRAPGVVIRNSRVSCASSYAVYNEDGAYTGTPLLIEDSEIDCKASTGTGVGEANITIRRTEITGCQNGGDLNQDIDIQDSYIHDLSNAGSDPHEDGLQFAWGHVENGQIVPASKNITLKHNTIYGINADGSFGTSAIITNRGGDTNVLIQNNLLAGGAVALYCEQGATGTNYRVLDNHFSRQFSLKVGFYGLSTDCSDETQSGNVIHETGEPVRLP